MKHIGIVGCSAEGAALCYRTVISNGLKRLGGFHHPEVSLHTLELDDYLKHLILDEPDWETAGNVLLASIEKLKTIGADFAICPDNTIHEGFNLVHEKSALPYLSIIDVVAKKAKEMKLKNLLILGTTYTMNGTFYPIALQEQSIKCTSPQPDEQKRIDSILWQELLHGSACNESVKYYEDVIAKYKGEGCDGVVLGCTEIPIIISDDNSALPVLDSTRLLADAALDYSLGL